MSDRTVTALDVRVVNAGATDLLMPDVMKCGGIPSWLKIAAMAEVYSTPRSNHLFAEVSAHLMAASPTAGWFEWCDWPSEAPGIGIEWNEAAVTRHELKV
jgi:mandelate racemase